MFSSIIIFNNKSSLILGLNEAKNLINKELNKININKKLNKININKEAYKIDLNLEKKYYIKSYVDTDKIVRIDTNWLKIFPIVGYVQLPLFTKKRNFVHYCSTVLGYYRNKYTGENLIRLDHGHRDLSKISAGYLIPPLEKKSYFKLSYFYWNKYSYLFDNTLLFNNKIIEWNMGLTYNYHLLKLSCTRYHNF